MELTWDHSQEFSYRGPEESDRYLSEANVRLQTKGDELTLSRFIEQLQVLKKMLDDEGVSDPRVYLDPSVTWKLNNARYRNGTVTLECRSYY